MSSARQQCHVVYPRGIMGVISPGRRDRCVYRDTVCSPACLKGPAVPVNTAELWGPHTYWGQVQVSWDVFMHVSVGRTGVCLCVCVLLCLWIRTCSKREGLNVMIIFNMAWILIPTWLCLCVLVGPRGNIWGNTAMAPAEKSPDVFCVFWPHCLFDSEQTSPPRNHMHHVFCVGVLHLWTRYLLALIYFMFN